MRLKMAVLCCFFWALAFSFYLFFVEINHPSIAILIHGCHVETKNWDGIMFGDELSQGRVSSGVEEALRQKAGLIIWGSGASITREGILESQYTFLQATHVHLDSLAQKMGLSCSKLLKFLTKISFLEPKAQNTKEEIRSALEICSERKIKKLVLISSPTHIARCLQEACKQKTAGKYRNILIYARASDVCFVNSTPEDVFIVEPPHRTDRSELPIHALIKKSLQIL
jgi:hypothetical protein